MIFKASLDRLAKSITTGVFALFVVIITTQIYLSSLASNVAAIVTVFLLVSIYIVTYVFRPVNYVVTKDQLVIHRIISDVIIMRADIIKVEILLKDQLKWTIRTFGVGGVFGYYGKFVNSKIGNMTWYVTRTDNMVLIATIKNENFVLSPDDVPLFIQSLNT